MGSNASSEAPSEFQRDLPQQRMSTRGARGGGLYRDDDVYGDEYFSSGATGGEAGERLHVLGSGGLGSLGGRRSRARHNRRRGSLGSGGSGPRYGGSARQRRRPFTYRLDARRFGGAGGGGGGGPLGLRRGRLLTLYSGVSAAHSRNTNALSALLFDTRTPLVTPEQANVDHLFTSAYLDACQRSMAGQDVSRAFSANEEFQGILDVRHASLYQENQAALGEVVARRYHDVLNFAKDIIDAEDVQLAAYAAEREGEVIFAVPHASSSGTAGSVSAGTFHPDWSVPPGFSAQAAAGMSASALSGASASFGLSHGQSTTTSPSTGSPRGSSTVAAAAAAAAAIEAAEFLQQRLAEAWLHYTEPALGRVLAWNGFFFCFWHSAVGEQYGQLECRASRWVLECHVPHLHVPLCYHIRYKGRGVTVMSLVPVADKVTAVAEQGTEVAAMAQEVASAFSLLPYVATEDRADGTVDGASRHYLPPNVQAHTGRDGRYYFLQNRNWLPRWISSRRAFDDYSQRLSSVTPRLLAARRVSLSCRAFDPAAFNAENKGAIEFMKEEINHGLANLLEEARDAETRRAARRAKREADRTLAVEEVARRALDAAEEAQRRAGGGTLGVPVFTPVTSSLSTCDNPLSIGSTCGGEAGRVGEVSEEMRNKNHHGGHAKPVITSPGVTICFGKPNEFEAPALDRAQVLALLCGSSDSSSDDDDDDGDYDDEDTRAPPAEVSGLLARGACENQGGAAKLPKLSSATLYPRGSLLRRFNRLGYPKNLLGALLLTLTCFPSPPLKHIREVKREIMFRGLTSFLSELMYEMRFGIQSTQARLPTTGVGHRGGGGGGPGADVAVGAWEENTTAVAANSDDELFWIDEGEWTLSGSSLYGWGTSSFSSTHVGGEEEKDCDDESPGIQRSAAAGGGGAKSRNRLRRSVSMLYRKKKKRPDPSTLAGGGEDGWTDPTSEEGFGVKMKRFARQFMGKPATAEEERRRQADEKVRDGTATGLTPDTGAGARDAATYTGSGSRTAARGRAAASFQARNESGDRTAPADGLSIGRGRDTSQPPPPQQPQQQPQRRRSSGSTASGSGARSTGKPETETTRMRKFLAFFGFDGAPKRVSEDVAANGTQPNPLRGSRSADDKAGDDSPGPGTESRERGKGFQRSSAPREGSADAAAFSMSGADPYTLPPTATGAFAALAATHAHGPDYVAQVERLLVAFMQYDGTGQPETIYARHLHHTRYQEGAQHRGRDRAAKKGRDGSPAMRHSTKAASKNAKGDAVLNTDDNEVRGESDGEDISELALEESAALNGFYVKTVLPRVYRKFRLTPRLVDLHAPMEEEDKVLVYHRLCAALGVRVTGGRVVEVVPTVKDFTPQVRRRATPKPCTHTPVSTSNAAAVPPSVFHDASRATIRSATSALPSVVPQPRDTPEMVYPLPRWVRLRTRVLVERLLLPALEGAVTHQRDWELHSTALIPFLALHYSFPVAEVTPPLRAFWSKVYRTLMAHLAQMPARVFLFCHACEQEDYWCYTKVERMYDGAPPFPTEDKGVNVAAAEGGGDGGPHPSAATSGAGFWFWVTLVGTGVNTSTGLRLMNLRTEADSATVLSLMRLEAFRLRRSVDSLEADEEDEDSGGEEGRPAHRSGSRSALAPPQPSSERRRQGNHPLAKTQRDDPRRCSTRFFINMFVSRIAQLLLECMVMADCVLAHYTNHFSIQYRQCVEQLVEYLPAVHHVMGKDGVGGSASGVPAGSSPNTQSLSRSSGKPPPTTSTSGSPTTSPSLNDGLPNDTTTHETRDANETSETAAPSGEKVSAPELHRTTSMRAWLEKAASPTTTVHGTLDGHGNLVSRSDEDINRTRFNDQFARISVLDAEGRHKYVSQLQTESGAIRYMLRQLETYCSQDLLLAQDYLQYAVMLCHHQCKQAARQQPHEQHADQSFSALHSSPPGKSLNSSSWAGSGSLSTTASDRATKEEIIRMFEDSYNIFCSTDGKNNPRALRALANLAVYHYTMGDHAEWHEALQQLRASWRDGGPEDIGKLLRATYSDFLAGRLATSYGSLSAGGPAGAASTPFSSVRTPQKGLAHWNASLFQSLRETTHRSGTSFNVTSTGGGGGGGLSILSVSQPNALSNSVMGALATTYSGTSATLTGPPVRFIRLNECE